MLKFYMETYLNWFTNNQRWWKINACYICISVFFVSILEKIACKYLNFKMSLYIRKRADLSSKWRHYGVIFSSNRFYTTTFLFQFLLWALKKNACKFLEFKMSLNKKNVVIMTSYLVQIDFIQLHFYSSFYC